MSKKAPSKSGTAKGEATQKTVLMTTHSSGAPRRLSDPDIKPKVDALREKLAKDPEAARRFLREVGYLTPKGNVTSRYS